MPIRRRWCGGARSHVRLATAREPAENPGKLRSSSFFRDTRVTHASAGVLASSWSSSPRRPPTGNPDWPKRFA
eukprot:2521915-Pyramimonas_sp.AAC.1